MAGEKREEEKQRHAGHEHASEALEGAAEEEAGFIHRDEAVEGGDELSIGGGPPSAAGGTRNSPLPTREDLREPSE